MFRPDNVRLTGNLWFMKKEIKNLKMNYRDLFA
jgi:hypothetical protein